MHRLGWRPRPLAPRTFPLGLRRVVTVVAALVWVIAVVLLGAAPASAHAALEETTPADGRTLEASPSTVTLRFNESMLGFGITVRVTGPGGDATDGKATVKGSIVTQPLDAGLAAGAYTVQWRVASKDGHPISGTSRFSVTAADPSPPPGPTASTAAATTPSPTTPPAATTTVPADGQTTGDEGGVGLPVMLAAGVAILAALAVIAAAITRRRRP